MEGDFLYNGLKIHYNEIGKPDGVPVIIMHGWGCDHTTVESIALALEDGMRVINVDLAGHGRSDEPSEIWGVEEYTELIRQLSVFLKIHEPSLIGHSFGGRIAIMYGSKYPVRKMVLVDAAGIKPKRSLRYYFKVYSYKFSKRLLKLIYGKEASKRKIENIVKKKGSADYSQSSEIMRGVMSRCVNQDLKKYMPHIKFPTLLIWGEKDTATPLSDGKTMEKLIPDAGLIVFPGCGHYSFLDNPKKFKIILREFFKPELKTEKFT